MTSASRKTSDPYITSRSDATSISYHTSYSSSKLLDSYLTSRAYEMSKRQSSHSNSMPGPYMTSSFHETSASRKTYYSSQTSEMPKTNKMSHPYMTSDAGVTSTSSPISASSRRQISSRTSPLLELVVSYVTSKSYETSGSKHQMSPSSKMLDSDSQITSTFYRTSSSREKPFSQQTSDSGRQVLKTSEMSDPFIASGADVTLTSYPTSASSRRRLPSSPLQELLVSYITSKSYETSESKRQTLPSDKMLDPYITSSSFSKTSAARETSGSKRETSKTKSITSASYPTSQSSRRRISLPPSTLQELLVSYVTSKSYETSGSKHQTPPSSKMLDLYITSSFHETPVSHKTSDPGRAISRTSEISRRFVTSGADVTSVAYPSSASSRRRVETSPPLDSYLASTKTASTETSSSTRVLVRLEMYITICITEHCCLSRLRFLPRDAVSRY